MPSLEIICINQLEPSDFAQLPFTVEAEKELISHRSPRPLFQADFDKLQGCIYHLLDEGGVTAYKLLKRDWFKDNEEGADNVEFRDELAPAIKELLEHLLLSSPKRQILFTTDYQFGPDEQRLGPISFAMFWDRHNAGMIKMNASYLITTD